MYVIPKSTTSFLRDDFPIKRLTLFLWHLWIHHQGVRGRREGEEEGREGGGRLIIIVMLMVILMVMVAVMAVVDGVDGGGGIILSKQETCT